jgi:hypothetical protein
MVIAAGRYIKTRLHQRSLVFSLRSCGIGLLTYVNKFAFFLSIPKINRKLIDET